MQRKACTRARSDNGGQAVLVVRRPEGDDALSLDLESGRVHWTAELGSTAGGKSGENYSRRTTT